jgi:hypothetical protein
MALRLSTQLRTMLAGTGGGLKSSLDGGWLDIYTGGQPTGADYAETGTKLISISTTSGTAATDGVTFGTAAAGALPKSGNTWSGAVITGGVGGWFRLYDVNHTTGSNGTAIRVDGNVGVSGSDLVLAVTSLEAGATLTIGTFTLTVPANS